MSKKKARAYVAQIENHNDGEDETNGYANALCEQRDQIEQAMATKAIKDFVTRCGHPPVDPEEFADWIEAPNIHDHIEWTDSPYGPRPHYCLASISREEWYEEVYDDMIENEPFSRKQLDKAFDKAGWHVKGDNSYVKSAGRTYYVDINVDILQDFINQKS